MNLWLLAAAGLLALAAHTTQAQQPDAAQVKLPPVPSLGPAPVRRAGATAAEQAEYNRQMTEHMRQRWNFMLTDSLARQKFLNTAPNALLAKP